MIAYWLVFGLILIVSFFTLFKIRRNLYDLYFLFVIFLICFTGLRGENVGFDYESYLRIFRTEDWESELIEPGFKLIVDLFRKVGSFNLFLLAVAFLSISIKSWYIYKYSYYPYVSLLVYFSIAFLLNDMGQIRYGLAVSFVLLYFHQLICCNNKKALLFLLLAILFHYSAIIVLPSYFFVNHVFTGRFVVALISCFSIFYIVNINVVLVWLGAFLPIPHIQGKILYYTTYTDTYGKSLGVNFSLILRCVVLYVLYQYKTYKKLNVSMWNILFNMYLYGILIYILFNSNAEFATRGSGYFKILDIIILPLFIYVSNGICNKLILWSFIVAYCVYSLGKIVFDVEFGGAYLPYSNLLFG